MGQVDWSCWDCGQPGFIVHKGRSQCTSCHQTSTGKTKAQVRALQLLLLCHREERLNRFLWLCLQVGILQEGLDLVS